MTYGKFRKDQEIYSQKQFDAIRKILPAPLAINLLSQIILIAAVYPDFEVICPSGGCKHLNYPSFKTSLLQLSYGAYDAFNSAHVNMDIIDRNMKALPNQVRFALITLLQGSEEDIGLLLPDQLKELRRIAQTSRDSAHATVENFTAVKEILEELLAGGKVTEKESTDKVKELDLKISNAQRRKENLENEKKDLKARKKEIKKNLELAEKNYEESIDKIPSGWDIIGLNFGDNLEKSFSNIINAVTGNVGNQAGQADPADKTKTPLNQTEPSVKFPGCGLAPATDTDVPAITEEQKVGINFADAVSNMHLTIQFLEEYIKNVFDRPTKDKLSLVANAEKLTETTKKLLLPNKDQIESTAPNTVPITMKSTAMTFYRKIFNLMDKVIETSKNRDVKPEDFKSLYNKAKDLQKSGQCFNTFVNRLLNLPAIKPETPFKANQNQTKKKSVSEQAVETAKYKVELWKERMDEQEKAFEKASNRLLIVSFNLTTKINELERFNASKATLGEVLEILDKALEKLSKLQTYWLEIREFFQLIQNMVDEEIANKVENYVNLLDNGSKSRNLRKKVYYKNRLYEYIQDINTNGYLVRKLSKTYLDVSNTYILPPVRKLGQMIEADIEESKRLRVKIAKETKTASAEMSRILKTQQREFLDSMKKRRDELEAIYEPIMKNLPEERQKEIENEVKEVSQDSRDFFLDV